jgi:nucleoside-diphosphate-sugar epimerase
VHVAGLASDWGRYEQFYQVNVSGTQNVAECALRSGVKRLVHISTSAIHGFPGFRYATEDTPLATTRWPYCETKKIAEQWLFKFSKSEGLPVSVIRPGNVFGPRDHTFFENYAEILLKGQLGYINGGRSWTCPTYIENLSEAILQACIEPNAVGEAFIITDGLEIDWRCFTGKIADALGVKHPRYSIPFPLAYFGATVMERTYEFIQSAHAPILTRYRVSNGGKDYHFSIQKAKRLLGYHPIVPLDEAIRRTAEWYLKAKRGEEAVSL